MSCDQTRPLLSPLLDEALPPSEAAKARAHVLSCAACGAEADALKRVSRLVRRARGADGTTHVWIARTRGVGTGEGSSGLVFDQALPTDRPLAPPTGS